jgi:hypothetical protein
LKRAFFHHQGTKDQWSKTSNSQFERKMPGKVAQPAMVALFPAKSGGEAAQPWLVALLVLPRFFQIENCWAKKRGAKSDVQTQTKRATFD